MKLHEKYHHLLEYTNELTRHVKEWKSDRDEHQVAHDRSQRVALQQIRKIIRYLNEIIAITPKKETTFKNKTHIILLRAKKVERLINDKKKRRANLSARSLTRKVKKTFRKKKKHVQKNKKKTKKTTITEQTPSLSA